MHSDSTFPQIQEAAGLLAQAAALLARLASKRTTAPLPVPPAPALVDLDAPADDGPAFLTTEQAAKRLGVSKKGLEALRARGAGPPFVRIGKAVRYPVDGLVGK